MLRIALDLKDPAPFMRKPGVEVPVGVVVKAELARDPKSKDPQRIKH